MKHFYLTVFEKVKVILYAHIMLLFYVDDDRVKFTFKKQNIPDFYVSLPTK